MADLITVLDGVAPRAQTGLKMGIWLFASGRDALLLLERMPCNA